MGHVKLETKELCSGIDVLIHGQQHFDTHEDEDNAQTIFQIFEITCNGGQCEIKGTKAKDSKYVRCKHDKRVTTYGEYGGNRVNSKSNISGLDDQQRDKQWCSKSLTIGKNEETVAM